MSIEERQDHSVPADYDLTCWYLNVRRVIELVGAGELLPQIGRIDTLAQVDDATRKSIVLGILKQSLTAWMHGANVPTLGQLLVQGKLTAGAMFTHYDRYFCKGLRETYAALEKRRTSVPPAKAYAKLDSFQQDLRLSFRFRHDHLTSNSSWSELSGQRRLLVLGMVTEITGNRIEAIPWVIADPFPSFTRPSTIVGKNWTSRLEVHVDSIDNFARVRNVRPPPRKDLEQLKEVPEAAIKGAFAEIIGEQTVPKDWGGEVSDLFSTWVSVDGERVSTAFAFKGPAKFRPMTMADLGKNGDQINRLFREPAGLLVLQHCHEITAPVRDTMRAFAQQMNNPRLFCLVNGYDTIRLLRAYRKCGFNR